LLKGLIKVNRIEEELRALTHSQKDKSGFYLPMDNEENNKNESVEYKESQRVF
jgi:hypothetical protein